MHRGTRQNTHLHATQSSLQSEREVCTQGERATVDPEELRNKTSHQRQCRRTEVTVFRHYRKERDLSTLKPSPWNLVSWKSCAFEQMYVKWLDNNELIDRTENLAPTHSTIPCWCRAPYFAQSSMCVKNNYVSFPLKCMQRHFEPRKIIKSLVLDVPSLGEKRIREYIRGTRSSCNLHNAQYQGKKHRLVH